MNHIKSLRIFGTIYLWIFVVKVLQVCGRMEYRTDADAAAAAATGAIGCAMIMKPYTYQIFDDYTDDLLNERNDVAIPRWQTLDKHQFYYKRLPFLTTSYNKNNNGNSMTSEEITFENLNDFNGNKIKNAIWPKILQQQEKQQQQYHHIKANRPNDNDIKQQQPRHSLQQFVLVHSTTGDVVNSNENKQQRVIRTNVKRFKQNEFLPIPIFLENRFKTKDKRTTTTNNNKSKTFTTNNSKTNGNEDEDHFKERDNVKENLFPLKDDNTLNENDDDDDNADDEAEAASVDNDETNDADNPLDEMNKNIGIANSNGNGNENLNYADNNVVNTNYKMMAKITDNDHNRDPHDDNKQSTRMITKKHLTRKGINVEVFDKRAKPSIGHTPFLPAVSGGAMTNLGKFFRDLSKNVHVSEQYQWNAEEQKLLEGDPNFSNIQHHLTKPHAATDQQTAEWIKAIRFYRPSQKIRSLVAMNPHGQWDHSSQFIDPNYMWVGLGK